MLGNTIDGSESDGYFYSALSLQPWDYCLSSLVVFLSHLKRVFRIFSCSLSLAFLRENQMHTLFVSLFVCMLQVNEEKYVCQF